MYNEVRLLHVAEAPQLGSAAGHCSSADLLSCLLQYLDRIGQLFFGVPPKQTSSYGGLLGKPRG